MDVFKQVEPIIFTGTTCLPGSLQLKKLSTVNPGGKVFCLVRPTSDTRHIQELDLNINYLTGDS